MFSNPGAQFSFLFPGKQLIIADFCQVALQGIKFNQRPFGMLAFGFPAVTGSDWGFIDLGSLRGGGFLFNRFFALGGLFLHQ